MFIKHRDAIILYLLFQKQKKLETDRRKSYKLSRSFMCQDYLLKQFSKIDAHACDSE